MLTLAQASIFPPASMGIVAQRRVMSHGRRHVDSWSDVVEKEEEGQEDVGPPDADRADALFRMYGCLAFLHYRLVTTAEASPRHGYAIWRQAQACWWE